MWWRGQSKKARTKGIVKQRLSCCRYPPSSGDPKHWKVLVMVTEVIRLFRGYRVAASAAWTLLPHLHLTFFIFMGVALYSCYSRRLKEKELTLFLFSLFSLLTPLPLFPARFLSWFIFNSESEPTLVPETMVTVSVMAPSMGWGKDRNLYSALASIFI